MNKQLFIAAILVFLSGCVETKPASYSRVAEGDSDVSMALAKCKMEANREESANQAREQAKIANMTPAMRRGYMSAAGFVSSSRVAEYVDLCMKSQGYARD